MELFLPDVVTYGNSPKRDEMLEIFNAIPQNTKDRFDLSIEMAFVKKIWYHKNTSDTFVISGRSPHLQGNFYICIYVDSTNDILTGKNRLENRIMLFKTSKWINSTEDGKRDFDVIDISFLPEGITTLNPLSNSSGQIGVLISVFLEKNSDKIKQALRNSV